MRAEKAGAGLAAMLGVIAVLLGFAGELLAGVGMTTVHKPSESELREQGYTFAGERRTDKFTELAGPETLIRIFRSKDGQELVGLYYLPNMFIYGFVRRAKNKPVEAFIDEDNTGMCNWKLYEGEMIKINYEKYYIKPSEAAKVKP
jgi:hypothetical protein